VYKRQIHQIAESNRNFFIPNWNAPVLTGERSATSSVHAAHSPPLIRAYAVTAAHRLRFARVDDHNRPCCFSQLERAT